MHCVPVDEDKGWRPRRASGASAKELEDGETVVLAPDGERAVVLNSMGAVIWDLCDGAHDVEEMVELICQHVEGAEPTQVRQDIAAVTQELRGYGLLDDDTPSR